ncbi:MAG: VanZ family protein [Blautia sp.]|nr:VanZ family protein [Blautia sp.]
MKSGGSRTFFEAALLASLAWMMVIFIFSAQPDTASAEVSGSVSYKIVEGVNLALHLELSQQQLEERALRIEFPVRKAAHMTEYAILASLILFVLTFRRNRGEWHRKRLLRYGLAFGLAVCYAATDEVHQRFVPGRAGQFRDVLIDACGAFLGLLVVFLFTNCYNRQKRKKR